MIEHPRYAPGLRVHVVPPDLVLVSDDFGTRAVHGAAFCAIAPLIGGVASTRAIAERLEDQVMVLDVHYALRVLEERGVIVESAAMVRAAVAGGSEAHGGIGFANPGGAEVVSPPDAAAALGADAAVSILACGKADAGDLVRALERIGARLDRDAEACVIVTHDYLDPALDSIAGCMSESGRRWILAKLGGAIRWWGPVFSPAGPCWGCVAERLRLNRPVDEFVARHGGREVTPLHVVHEVDQASGLDLVAAAIAAWLIDPNDPRHLAIHTFDPRNGEHLRHAIPAVTSCRHRRGGSEAASPSPRVTLEPRQRAASTDGGHRAVPARETLARFEHHSSSITGIVDGLRPLDEGGAVRVYTAGYAFPPRLAERGFAERRLRAWATGKGIGDEQARLSALAEAIERHSGLVRGDEPLRRASLDALGDEAVHPNACMRISERQYRERDAWNERERDANWIPERFDPGAETDWAPLWSLVEERVRYVPAAYCYYGFPCPPGHDFCRPDSNGNAAGNTLEEAILQALLEVVERDAVALWWYTRARRPALDPAQLALSYAAELSHRYAELGRRWWLLDLTTDLGVPVFAAISLPVEGDGADGLVLGFGAHLDPCIAANRALTEMNQFLPA